MKRRDGVYQSSGGASKLAIELPSQSKMPVYDLAGQVVLVTCIGCIGEDWDNGTTFATLLAVGEPSSLAVRSPSQPPSVPPLKSAPNHLPTTPLLSYTVIPALPAITKKPLKLV